MALDALRVVTEAEPETDRGVDSEAGVCLVPPPPPLLSIFVPLLRKINQSNLGLHSTAAPIDEGF